jgi:hypothetical protein
VTPWDVAAPAQLSAAATRKNQSTVSEITLIPFWEIDPAAVFKGVGYCRFCNIRHSDGKDCEKFSLLCTQRRVWYVIITGCTVRVVATRKLWMEAMGKVNTSKPAEVTVDRPAAAKKQAAAVRRSGRRSSTKVSPAHVVQSDSSSDNGAAA